MTSVWLLLMLLAQPQPPAAEPAAGPAVVQNGGVAVVLNMPDDDPAHFAIARGVIEGARRTWGLLDPPLRPEAVSLCNADNTCLVKLASEQGASHLYLVGVAPLSEEEVVVSLQLLDLRATTELKNYTDVLFLEGNAYDVGARLFAEHMADAPGVPGPDETEPTYPKPPPPIDDSYGGVSILSIAGWSVLGGGAAVAVAGAGLGAVFTFVPIQGVPARNLTAVVAGPLAVGLIAVGAGLVAADLFLH